MLEEPIEVCEYCGKIMVLDHMGQDGSRYMRCPICDADPKYCAVCGHVMTVLEDGQTICSHCDDSLIVFSEDIREQHTVEGIEIRDCAFLWSVGIRADDDLIKENKCYSNTKK